MKKALTISLIFVMLLAALTTGVYAVTSSKLADELYAKGAKYGMTATDKVKIERYLSENPVTEAEANSIVEKADEAIAVMDEAGVTSYNDLTEEQKSEVKSIAQEAADVIDVTLVFGTKSVSVYKDGKLVEEVTNNDSKLAYTGNSTNIVIAVSGVAIIALAMVAVLRKRLANA